jgi:hypothetical protein
MRHVRLTCLNHPNLRWQCKSIAVNSIGQYNGARNIFFLGSAEKADKDIADIGDFFKNAKVGEALTTLGADCPECTCPPSDLRFAPEEIERVVNEPLNAEEWQ